MAEYIKREAALEVAIGWREQLIPNYGENDEYVKCLETVAEHLYDIPAADVRPVVFCRNCIHYKPQQKSARWSNTTPMCSRSATIKMPPDGFCSFGVEREES